MIDRRRNTGFTIVELLIVIVVIGILAAITIVAYNGIQGRATAASLTSDLDNASRRMNLFQVDNNGYPISNDCSASPLIGSICLKSSNGNGYTTYTTQNTNPQSFCITANNGSVRYSVNQDGAPFGGDCTVTNLALNPSMESINSNWGNYVAGGTASSAPQSGGAYSGGRYYRVTWTADATVLSGGMYPFNMGSGLIAEGKTYTASLWIRSSKAQNMSMDLTYMNSGGTGITHNYGPNYSLAANVWTRVSATASAPAGSFSVLATAYARTGGTKWVVGDYLDGDAAMLTEGSTLYEYADGNSNGWAWSGTVNNSTSSGTPQ